jgi:hypothetical protein
MLALLKTAYPNFYSKMTRTEAEAVVTLWAEMFAEDDVNIVKYAMKELIATHSGFPPDIAAIKSKMRECVSVAVNEPTTEELWQKLKKAASNGFYGAKEEFDRLPPILQRYVGSPNGLTDLAKIDSDTFNTVTRGQFYKQIEIVKERERYSAKMPDEIKMLISSLHNSLTEHKTLTITEENDRRNNLLNLLESGG